MGFFAERVGLYLTGLGLAGTWIGSVALIVKSFSWGAWGILAGLTGASGLVASSGAIRIWCAMFAITHFTHGK